MVASEDGSAFEPLSPSGESPIENETAGESGEANSELPVPTARLTKKALRRHTSSLHSSPPTKGSPGNPDFSTARNASRNIFRDNSSVDVWAIPLSQFFEPRRVKRGKQLRAARIVHDCCGLEVVQYAAEPMSIRIQLLATTDPKPAVLKLLKQNHSPCHHYRYSRDSCAGKGRLCILHNSTECVVDFSQGVDVYVNGFPCQPFSIFQVANMKRSNAWEYHEKFYVTDDCINFMKLRRPRKCLFENVLNMLMDRAQDDMSALKQFLRKIDNIGGYLYMVLKLPVSSWIQLSRWRI